MNKSSRRHLHDRLLVLVVGAGFAGATAARELAEAGHEVLVIDKRNHVAGNAHDFVNEHGIRVHTYGPHLWHTSNTAVHEWASKFTSWVPYKHWVRALLPDGRTTPLPINADTISDVFRGIPMSPEDMMSPATQEERVKRFLKDLQINHDPITNSRELVESSVGEQLTNLFFAPYSQKMWGMPLEKLPASVAGRIPTKTSRDKFYFPNDTHQFLPTDGYTKMVENILSHPNIYVSLSTERAELPQYAVNGYSKWLPEKWSQKFDAVFTSEPIDTYFCCDLGELPWRSIKFHTHSVPVPKLLDAPVINFTHNGPHTRVTEWSQLPNSGQNPYWTTITAEEPCDYRENNMERYYPVKTSSETDPHRAVYKQYAARAEEEKVHFIGRAGLYVYMDMHMAISSTLSVVRKFLRGEENESLAKESFPHS